MADDIGVMYLGRLCEVAPVDDIFDNPLHPYTQLLLETIPDVEMTGRKRAPVAGEIPNPIDPPSGCPFHPRCPLMAAYCREVNPELEPWTAVFKSPVMQWLKDQVGSRNIRMDLEVKLAIS